VGVGLGALTHAGHFLCGPNFCIILYLLRWAPIGTIVPIGENMNDESKFRELGEKNE
jgi:hypothetical protein